MDPVISGANVTRPVTRTIITSAFLRRAFAAVLPNGSADLLVGEEAPGVKFPLLPLFIRICASTSADWLTYGCRASIETSEDILNVRQRNPESPNRGGVEKTGFDEDFLEHLNYIINQRAREVTLGRCGRSGSVASANILPPQVLKVDDELSSTSGQ
ncbi:hypothetical protein TcWFU_005272 [Taenia crassiceps]|uniref:Uncharacterized protein n=1 Tax=Taenia crassiceps TaxID=6207 RepID=A0ABR4QBA5_9CEST